MLMRRKTITIGIILIMLFFLIFSFSCKKAKTSYRIPNGKIGQATQDENGGVVGGKPGDQTGNEVKITDYSFSESKSFTYWKYVIRCTDPDNANTAATFVESACKNDSIGYNNYENTPEGVSQRNSLYEEASYVEFDASAIKNPVDISCTPLVLTGFSASGIIMDGFIDAVYEGVENQYTCRTVNAESLTDAIELVNATYEERGEEAPFMIIEMTRAQFTDYKKNLKRGDVLCTGHHTAMML